MPSPAFRTWSTDSAASLAQLEQIAAAGGDRDVQQVRHAYVLLLCAHFQAYCRGLYSDATQVLVESIDPQIGAVLDANLSFARQLDRGNAQPGSLSLDFGRFGIVLWTVAEAANPCSAERRRKLEELNAWRNAIAHHDIEGRRDDLIPQQVTLAACRTWRGAVDGLAKTFDEILTTRLQTLIGRQPW